jgi:hypothetical protein
MSDHLVQIIPDDSAFVPPPEAQKKAIDLLESLAPDADEVRIEVSGETRFVGCGSNWESVFCPFCGTKLEVWFWAEMETRSKANGFKDLAVETPCCLDRTTLDGLRYGWPVGFARFALVARNTALRGNLGDDQKRALEAALGCPVRVILSRV